MAAKDQIAAIESDWAIDCNGSTADNQKTKKYLLPMSAFEQFKWPSCIAIGDNFIVNLMWHAHHMLHPVIKWRYLLTDGNRPH